MSIFKRFPLLKDLSARALADLKAACCWTSASSGKQIVLANEPAGDVYFIVSGKVRVLLYSAAEGKPVLFATLKAFEMFGEIAAIDRRPRSATVEAEEDCSLDVLTREQFPPSSPRTPRLLPCGHEAPRGERSPLVEPRS